MHSATTLRIFLSAVLGLGFVVNPSIRAQDATAGAPGAAGTTPTNVPPVPAPTTNRGNASAAADRQRMMDLLHIPPPGPFPSPTNDPNRPPNTRPVGGNSPNWTDDVPGHTIVRSSWGNWSNYSEDKANRYPLPDALMLKNGQPVKDAETWWKQRRPEILNDFLTEIYGKIPKDTPKVTWEVAKTDTNALDGTAIMKTVTGHVDNSADPDISVNLSLTVYTPAKATGPVPLIMVVSGGFGGGGRGRGFGASNAPAGTNVPVAAGGTNSPARAGGFGGGSAAMSQVIARGWGYATFNTSSVQADNGGGLNQGIIGLVNQGQPRKPDDWGVLAAWSWGLSRALDYLETDKAVDAKKVGLEGHSRWGKEALIAMAFDERFAIVYSSCSGEGGAKLHRHDVGESVDNVAGTSEYHWMAGNFLKYAGHWNELPVDSHELIALCAPRPVFVTGGTQDLWSDPVGEFRAVVAAGPVYRLLGRKDAGTTEMPAPDVELISGDLAYREHAGGHTDAPDWPTFLKFAGRYFEPGSAASATGEAK